MVTQDNERAYAVILALVAGLVLVFGAVAFGQTTVTERLQVTALPTAAGTSCVAVDADGVFSKVGAGCGTGDITGVSFTLPSIFTAPSACTSGDCSFTFTLATQAANLVFAGPSTGSAAAPTFRSLVKADFPAATVFTDQANTFSASYTQTFSGSVAINNGIASHLIPSLTDTYDLGSSTKLWNQGYLSQLNAVLFAETTATLFGGWSIIGKNAGTFPARVASTDTTVNFGKTMTPGHFIAIRAHDEGGTLPTAEYLQVGSLVSGTTYNVTRNLSGLGAKNWPSGTSFLVNGTTGDGRIELLAYTTPRISILSQGATYNAQTEHVRIGYLDGMPSMAAGKIGVYIGDLGSSGLAYYDGSLQIRGSVTVTGGNAATTSYADSVASTAQSTAISTAASDATTKANTAQSTAISTASSDATTKANNAYSSAVSWATSNRADTTLSNVLSSDVRAKTGWGHASNATLIDGGDIYTGSIYASSIAANTITASQIASTAIDGFTITGSTIRTSATDANGVRKATLDSNGLTLGVASSNSDYGAQMRWLSSSTNVSQFGYWNSEAHWWGGSASAINIGAQDVSTSGGSEDAVINLASNNSANAYAQAIFDGPSNEIKIGTWSGGAFRPKTTAYTSLGTSSYKWHGGYFSAELHSPGLEITNFLEGYGNRFVCTDAGAGTTGYLYRALSSGACSTSSLRYKQGVAPMDTANAAAILEVVPKTFQYKDEPNGPHILGAIAEDVADLGLEWLVVRDAQGRPDRLLYDRIALYLIPVVREQRDEIVDLKARLSALEARLEPK